MPKLVQILEKAAPAAQNATAIFAEAEAIETIIVQMEPGARSLLTAEWAKIKTAVSAIVTAAVSFEQATVFGKATQAFSLLSEVLGIGSVLQGIYADGQTYFGSAWPQVQAHLATIKELVLGTVTPAATPVATPAAASRT
jgi:hypothetical protein